MNLDMHQEVFLGYNGGQRGVGGVWGGADISHGGETALCSCKM